MIAPWIACTLIVSGLGSVSAGTATLGTVMARYAYIGVFDVLLSFQFIGECAAGTVLYLIAFHRRMTALSPAPQLFPPAGNATDSAAEARPTSP